MARILMLGRQGAGKGTQSARAARRLRVPHVSTGDCFRAAIASGTSLGRQVKAFIDRGDLVPDEVVLDVVAARLSDADAAGGFVLDGFPRTRAQADALIELLAPAALDVAIDLDVPARDVLERMLRRRVCRSCGEMRVAPKPGQASVDCPCGGVAVRRDDDEPEAIRHRLDLYEAETAPVIDLCRRRGLLVRVDGRGDADDVEARIAVILAARVRPVAVDNGSGPSLVVAG